MRKGGEKRWKRMERSETDRGMLLRPEKRKKEKDQERKKKEGKASFRLKGRLTGWRPGSQKVCGSP